MQTKPIQANSNHTKYNQINPEPNKNQTESNQANTNRFKPEQTKTHQH